MQIAKTRPRLLRRIKGIARDSFSYIALGTLTIAMAVPFVWMISSSFKAQGYIFIYPPQWIPNPIRWQNYIEVMQKMPFVQFFFNSGKIAFLATFGQLLTCSLTAYVFARSEFPGRDLLFKILLATMMVPSQVTMIPVFIIVYRLGLMDTHLALWGPAFFGGAYGTFLLRQFFLTLPGELEDAARIDGCGRFGIWWRIFLPLSKPALTTLAIFVFMGQWNNLLGPVLYLSTKSKMTLTIGLAMFFHQWGATPWNLVMAGAVISIIPVLVIFALGQEYFVKGMIMSGIKG
jgi:multiple sugar transport system permease protein